MNKKKAFYAHCVSIYDTKQEERDLELLNKLGYEVFNPNKPEYSKMYKELGMMASVKFINDCDVLAFSALPGGHIPAGVYKEIMIASDKSIPIFEIPMFSLRKIMTVNDTRAYIKEVGKR